MIEVTESAASEVKTVLDGNGAASDRGLRLVRGEKGAVNLTIDRPQAGDDVVKDGERPLVIVESAIARRLDGVVFDVERLQPSGRRFILRGFGGTGS